MKKRVLIVLFVLQFTIISKIYSQSVSINTTGNAADASAMLDISSDSKGILIPRMTQAQKLAIYAPADGLLIYQTDGTKGFYFYSTITSSWNFLAGSVGLTSLNGLTANSQTFATGTTGTDFNISSSGSAHTFNIPDASASVRGVLTTGAQTIAGPKTFSTAPLFSSLTPGSVPYIGTSGLLSQNNASFFWDATNVRLGIGTNAPAYRLQVSALANPLSLLGVQTGTNTDSILTITDGVVKKLSPSALTTSSNNAWALVGNNVTSVQKLGTLSAFDLPIITNNTTRMTVTSSGNVGIGSTSFDASNPEKLLVDAGSVVNPTTSFNVISGKGYIDNYLQLNIQNRAPGASASSDIVASNNAATETTNFIDMGINSSVNSSTGVLGGFNTGYLYSTGGDLAIGNAAAGRSLNLFTGGTALSNERMRITSDGNVGIGTTTPANKLQVSATANPLSLLGVQTGGTTDDLLTITDGGVVRKMDASAMAWALGGNNVTSAQKLGTTSAFDLPIITNNATRMTVTSDGRVGIGSTSFDATNPEELLVDAGSSVNPSTSYNVISGKGYIDNYLQLNIQNRAPGVSASSDVVASNNAATETVNFIDMGINSSVNTSTGVLGGANTGYLYSTGSDLAIGNGTANRNLNFFTGGTAATNERMRINSAGNVGIGSSTFDATNPEKLLVDAGTTTSVNGMAIKGTINNYLQFNIQNRSTGPSASTDIVATANNGTESNYFIDMGINGSGNNGNFFGNANDAYLYSVGQNLYIGNGTANKYLSFITGGINQTTNERMRIDGNGNVLIGTTTVNGANKLTVSGSISATAFNVSSDRRLKTNIKSLQYGLNEILALQPVSYNWKKTPTQDEQLGLIAQDAKETMPEVVSGNEAAGKLSINYTALIPVLINAIKEQQQQINDLKEIVKKLQK